MHTLRRSITILMTIGILGSGWLVWNEFQTGNGCPKIASIPVCLIVLICFLVPMVSHISNKLNILYFIFSGTALVIAIFASIAQISGTGECPSLYGSPMCYWSLLLFANLIILKIILIRKKAK